MFWNASTNKVRLFANHASHDPTTIPKSCPAPPLGPIETIMSIGPGLYAFRDGSATEAEDEKLIKLRMLAATTAP